MGRRSRFGEAAGRQPEDADGREQGVGVAEPQARDAGPVLGADRIADLANGGWPSAGSWLSFSASGSVPAMRVVTARGDSQQARGS